MWGLGAKVFGLRYKERHGRGSKGTARYQDRSSFGFQEAQVLPSLGRCDGPASLPLGGALDSCP